MTPVPYALTGKAHAALAAAAPPLVVCLCGSTRFGAEFRAANLRLTLAGQIVLSIGCDTRSDADLAAAAEFGGDPAAVKARLDELHKRKIDLADYVLAINPGGYVGESTRSEIDYARALGKPVRYLQPPGDDHDPGWACAQCGDAYFSTPPGDDLCPPCRDAQPSGGDLRVRATAPRLHTPPAWTDDALCAQSDPDAWFPEPGHHATLARLICQACPVRVPCLDDALARNERHGIWGGMDERERRALAARRRAATAQPGHQAA